MRGRVNLFTMVGLIVVLAVIAFLFIDFMKAPAQMTEEGLAVGTEIGNVAPSFSAQTPDGETVNLEDFRGRAVMVNFWATWCPFCLDEMPLFQEMYEKHQDELVILGVNLQERDIATINSYANSLGVTYPILLDPDGEIAALYNYRVPPTTYFIDKNGVIQARKFGPITEEELNEKLERIL